MIDQVLIRFAPSSNNARTPMHGFPGGKERTVQAKQGGVETRL
jgi:hypothetical protein